jgi:Protein of unknown function (DUF2971)
MATGLFKYLPTNFDKLKWFANCQILLTPPEYFNDPWDFFVHFEAYTDAQLEKEAQKLNLSIEQLKEAVTIDNFLPKESLNYQKEIGKMIGIVSLAENSLDRVMWAHYAESHHGFVAEFVHDKEFVEDGFHQRVGPFGCAAKVQYLEANEQQPEYDRDSSNPAKDARIFWTKHSHWRYEQEWRVVQSHGKATASIASDGSGRSLLNFEPTHLSRVIFGSRICPKVEAKLNEMLARPEFKNVRKEQANINPATNELSSCELH